MAGKKDGGHHGGAWKVAYADFVTAMMALFMVLWITAQDKEILLATSKYFKQPFHALSDQSIGVISGKNGSTDNEKSRGTLSQPNLAFLHALAKELNRMLNISDAVQSDDPVDMKVTSDGLKITVYDRSRRPIFENGSTKFTEWGLFVMQNLAWLVERNKLKASIDGHAATGTSTADAGYGLWELTADRANAARRAMEKYGTRPDEIERVTGYADTKPLPNVPPESESNQRITVSLVVNH